MKQIKSLFLTMVALMGLLACGGDEPDPILEPQVFQRSLQLPAEEGQQTYTASDLKVGISIVQETASWLTVETLAYSNGSPKVEIEYDANTGGERQAMVTLTDVNNNKVFLTVTQEALITPVPGIDDPHDTQSDQPAYSRQQ